MDGRQIKDFNKRVGHFHQSLFSILKEYKVSHGVLENCFVGINPLSALKLGTIRGSFIAAMARLSLPVFEISPTRVKKIITGNGHASKEEVQLSLRQLLCGYQCSDLSYDASDALAVALSFGLSNNWLE